MPSKITSPVNARIKELARLRNSSDRRETGLILVDQLRDIRRALEAGLVCRELYGLEGSSLRDLPKKAPLPVELSPQAFAKIAYGERDDGWIGVFETPAPRKTLPDVKDPLYLILDHLEKPGNIGAILRTADAVGINGVVLCDAATDLYNPNIIRSSTGMVFSLPVVCWERDKAFEYFKSRGVRVCVADPGADNIYTSVNMSSGLALVVGQEDQGVSDFWMDRAEIKVKIPMNGRADSLNVSISAAVILYEAIRQRSR